MITLILLVAAAVAVGVAGSVIWATFRSVDWAIGLLRGPTPATASPSPDPIARCRQSGCQTANAPHARFCRRCGSPMLAVPDPPRARDLQPSYAYPNRPAVRPVADHA